MPEILIIIMTKSRGDHFYSQDNNYYKHTGLIELKCGFHITQRLPVAVALKFTVHVRSSIICKGTVISIKIIITIPLTALGIMFVFYLQVTATYIIIVSVSQVQNKRVVSCYSCLNLYTLMFVFTCDCHISLIIIRTFCPHSRAVFPKHV